MFFRVTSRLGIVAVIAVLAALPLAGALLSQYGFGYAPCKLCLLQRYPYALMLLWAFAAYALSVAPKWALLVAALLAQVSGGIGLFHAGVEAGWWVYESSCTSGFDASQSLNTLKAALSNAPLVACDQAMLEVMGLSMAAWNVIYAFICALLLWMLARKEV